MIELKPVFQVKHRCPHCSVAMAVEDWTIPGMRALAAMHCNTCGRRFYGDLPVGQAIETPVLLDRDTGEVHEVYPVDVKWFAEWLRSSYSRRTDEPLSFTEEVFSEVEHGLLLNCLDAMFGHCLLKLLNAQRHIDRDDGDLVVLVPTFLRWLVPDGAAAIWTVDLSLQDGRAWNDWLAGEVRRRINRWPRASISEAISHPDPAEVTIERFSRVEPMAAEAWLDAAERPVVTYIWREDRLWSPRWWERRTLRALHRGFRWGAAGHGAEMQRQRVLTFARLLRRRFPRLDFAVVGVGETEDWPHWITPLVTRRPQDAWEREACVRYSESHVVVGVHGSGMLLPSAHAGATVELVPDDRWNNLAQDLLLRATDTREALLAYRTLPIATSPRDVANIVASMLQSHVTALGTLRVRSATSRAGG